MHFEGAPFHPARKAGLGSWRCCQEREEENFSFSAEKKKSFVLFFSFVFSPSDMWERGGGKEKSLKSNLEGISRRRRRKKRKFLRSRLFF